MSSGGACFGSARTRQTAGSKDKQSLSMISKSLDHQHIVSPNRTRLFNVVLGQIILEVATIKYVNYLDTTGYASMDK